MTGVPYTDGGSNFDAPGSSYELSVDRAEDEPPSTAVVRAVAILTNTSPLDLPPLYHAIDPDHLDRLVQHSTDCAVQTEISFRYHGFGVVVTEDEILVRAW